MIQMYKPPTIFLLLSTFIFTIFTYDQYSTCVATSSNFYDIITHKCTPCPSNTVQAPDPTYCNCSLTYYPNPSSIGFNSASSCLALNANRNGKAVPLFDTQGKGIASPVAISCDAGGYVDASGLNCMPCGQGMTYNTVTATCDCNNGLYQVSGRCYSLPTGLTAIGAEAINNIVGCKQYQIPEACQQMINRCVASNYASTSASCSNLLSGSYVNLPTYTFSNPTDSINISASAKFGTNSSTVQSQLQFILVEYFFNGTINDIKPLDSSVFPCSLSEGDTVKFMSFGLRLSVTCSAVRSRSVMYYDAYVIAEDGKYTQVPVLINGVYYKRFSFSGWNTVSLTYISVPPLQVPILALSNSNTVSVSTISTSSSTSINYLIPVIVFMVLVFVVFIIDFYRYLSYNPDENNDPYYCCKVLMYALIYIMKYLGVGLWLFLLAFGAYVFGFFKFQQSIYIMLLDASGNSSLSAPYKTIFFICLATVLIAVGIQLFNISTNVDYFLIDWEKEKSSGLVAKVKKEVSVWRKVLLVNELYKLSITRLVSVQVISLFCVLLLEGAEWIGLAQAIPNSLTTITDPINIDSLLAYAIITSLIFIVALVQLGIRFFLRVWYAMPAQDFVDLCSVSNISIVIFDQALHGYYLHGMNPIGHSEGSLQDIESMFQKQSKSFGKSRSFRLDDADHTQTFEVIYPMKIRESFQVKYKSHYLQKLAAKSYNTSVLANPVPENLNEEDYKQIDQISLTMLESFKYYLEGVKTTPMNVRETTWAEKIVGCPVSSSGKLPVFLKDSWGGFSNVLLSGHQWLLICNFANMVNLWFMITQSVWMGFFLALLFEKYVVMYFAGVMIKRNISRNTLIDDKFFI